MARSRNASGRLDQRGLQQQRLYIWTEMACGQVLGDAGRLQVPGRVAGDKPWAANQWNKRLHRRDFAGHGRGGIAALLQEEQEGEYGRLLDHRPASDQWGIQTVGTEMLSSPRKKVDELGKIVVVGRQGVPGKAFSPERWARNSSNRPFSGMADPLSPAPGETRKEEIDRRLPDSKRG